VSLVGKKTKKTEPVVEVSIDRNKPGWFINLEWYRENNRSFFNLAKGYLCPECREQVREEVSPEEIFATIKSCCSQKQGFFTSKLPVLDSTFRLFLANGNQPLELEELAQQLSERRENTYHIPTESLSRLLEDEQYYGIRHTSG